MQPALGIPADWGRRRQTAGHASLPRQERHGPCFRHRDGQGWAAGDDADAGPIRGPRRGQAPAAHAVRQQASAHQADRDAARDVQHHDQPDGLRLVVELRERLGLALVADLELILRQVVTSRRPCPSR